MPKKTSDQLSFDLEAKHRRDAKHSSDAAQAEKSVAQIHSFENAKRTKTYSEENKYVRAILDLVRHYK
jgi:hypothetical protein